MAFNNMFYYLFLCLFFFGIGEFLGVLTKARLSAVFVSLMLFLVCFMTGVIPPDIIAQAKLDGIGKWAVIFIVFSMGTTINLKEFIEQWRTLTTAVLAMAFVMLSGVVLIPLVGYNEAIVSIPIINGGIVATQIMTNSAMEHGFTMAAALGTIVFAVQKFVGTPFASHYGLKEARMLVEEYRKTGTVPPEYGAKPKAVKAEGEKKLLFWEQHKNFYGNFTCLTITGLFCWVAFVLGKNTGIAASIWALILGCVAGCTGMLPKNILKHANSAGIFNAACFATIIPSLARITPSDLVHLGIATAILFVVVLVTLYLFFYVLPFWKILGSKNVAMGVAVCQLLGFPATYLIVNEVAQAVGQTEEERRIISDRLMPKYLVAGFTTVTSLSVIAAGIFEKFL